MRVLVIGGTGTVGPHVVRELLTRGAEASALTRGHILDLSSIDI